MIDAEQIIESAIRSLPDVAARIRLDGHDIIEPVVCSTFDFHRRDSDLGLFEEAAIKIRLAADAEPNGNPLALDAVIEVARPASEDWTKLRVVTRKITAGLLTLTMANPNE